MADEVQPFGQVLRRLRTGRGLSLGALAEAVHYSKGQLSKIENGAAAPSPQFAQLCDAALDSGGALTAMLSRYPARRRGGPARIPLASWTLPRQTSHFTGRQRELDQLLAFLVGPPPRGTAAGASRVCVVHGMPGVGKTALAISIAYRVQPAFPDGCIFVDLHGCTPSVAAVHPASALDRCLRQLGVPGQAIPPHTEDRTALFREQVHGRRMLLVLDNAASAAQVEPLLPAAAGCAILVTSRRRLAALDDAAHHEVDVLPPAHAAALFRSVAGAVPDGPAAEEAIGRIVRRCGYLPLAVRIAAARLRHQPNPDLADLADLDRLLADDRSYLGELDDGERTAASAFGGSLNSLSPEEQAVLLHLARHPGADFDVPAAAAMAGTDPACARRRLDRLLEAHLVAWQSAGRYRLHDLVRAYAVQVAQARQPTGAGDAALRRLLDHYLRAAQACDVLIAPHRYHPPLDTPTQPDDPARPATRAQAVGWMATEQANLMAACRAAAEHGLPGHCWQLAYNLRGYFFLTKDWSSWIDTHRIALAAARDDNDRRGEGYLLNGLGLAHFERGEVDTGAEYYEQALTLFTTLGDRRGISNTLGNYAWVHDARGQHREALLAHQTALTYYEETTDQHNIAVTLRGIGLAEVGLRAFTAAIEHLTRARDLFVRLGLPLDEAMARNCLGDAHLRRGDLPAALAAYETAATVAGMCGSRYEQARALHGMAATTDNPHLRRHRLAAALEFYSSLGAPEADQVRTDLAALPNSDPDEPPGRCPPAG